MNAVVVDVVNYFGVVVVGVVDFVDVVDFARCGVYVGVVDHVVHNVVENSVDHVVDNVVHHVVGHHVHLDHVVDHVRYCVKSIREDLSSCIELMNHHPGPNFAASMANMKLTEPDNAVLDIFCDPPFQTNSNLVLWPSKDFPLSFQSEEQTQELVSIIEQEIEILKDQVTLCTRLLDHPDKVSGRNF